MDNEQTKRPKKENTKDTILAIRLGKEEVEMVKFLKGSPYFMNISEYLRATIKHIYESKTNKAGRVK